MSRVAGLIAALFAALPGPALACALELILAVDVSGSIDPEEWALQAEGMAAAFEEPAVIAAIEGLPGGVLVTYTQWSGIAQQAQVTPWALIRNGAEARAYAGQVRRAWRRWSLFSTAIGEALRHARDISREAPLSCARKVVDISGDGYSNEGPFPGPMADEMAAEGFVINGLVIEGAEPDPVPHFLLEVIAGKGAFVETAADFDDFPAAFQRKLLREIGSDLVVGALR